jgi:hypothetical protein
MVKKHYLRTTRNLYYIEETPQLRVYYSYTTPVALMINNHLKVSQNQWSITTARHLTWIDGGNKQDRLKPEEFNKLVKQHEPKSNIIKTVSMVSAMFGIMCNKKEEKTKNKFQKKFFETVQGMNFPSDWDSLSEEEKSKRLNKVTKIGLKND